MPPRVRKNNLRPLGIQIGKTLFNLPPVYLGTAGTAGKDKAHRRADSPLPLVFSWPYKVQVHYRGAVRGLFLLCRLFNEHSRIERVYSRF